MTLNLTLAADLPLVRADPAAVEQVLGNFLDNALKYAAQGGVIAVDALVEGPAMRISVRDCGPGIGPEHLPRLFERFYRVDNGRSRAAGGTGLGLAIAKHLAESMHGQVGVHSVVGQGSVFWLQVPLA